MANYYYLISSLPSLSSGSSVPVSYSEFLRMCRPEVSRSVYECLADMKVSGSEKQSGLRFFRQWSSFSASLYGELNRRRRERAGKHAEPSGYVDSGIRQFADSVMSAENPLEAERILLDVQLRFLESLVNGHFFDDYVLFGYAISLKLLERQALFDKAKGYGEFTRLADNLKDGIMNM